MQSRLEARWAIFFMRAGFEWSYEPCTFKLSNGEPYTPDFYLPEIGWIEIKATVRDARIGERKFRIFAAEKNQLIPNGKRNEFYTICAPEPRFDVRRVHQWNPEPTEFYYMKDVYLHFCSHSGREQARRWNLDYVEFVKNCLFAAKQYNFEPLMPPSEWVFKWRCQDLGTSFRQLSRAYKENRHLPITDREIQYWRQQLRIAEA